MNKLSVQDIFALKGKRQLIELLVTTGVLFRVLCAANFAVQKDFKLDLPRILWHRPMPCSALGLTHDVVTLRIGAKNCRVMFRKNLLLV